MHLLPFAIGAAGLILMMFVMLVMYRSVRNEDAATAPVTIEENADRQPDPMVPEPPADSTAKPAAKPDKRPPLDER
jgi:ribosomal protein L11